jgi:hypothetical protein
MKLLPRVRPVGYNSAGNTLNPDSSAHDRNYPPALSRPEKALHQASQGGSHALIRCWVAQDQDEQVAAGKHSSYRSLPIDALLTSECEYPTAHNISQQFTTAERHEFLCWAST